MKWQPLKESPVGTKSWSQQEQLVNHLLQVQISQGGDSVSRSHLWTQPTWGLTYSALKMSYSQRAVYILTQTGLHVCTVSQYATYVRSLVSTSSFRFTLPFLVLLSKWYTVSTQWHWASVAALRLQSDERPQMLHDACLACRESPRHMGSFLPARTPGCILRHISKTDLQSSQVGPDGAWLPPGTVLKARN